ncbi:response regulator transcription factor [Cryomorphaceae bacterium]|nr:response regulator transcription factor [Cryomorphaceae bacterium]
MMKHRVFIVDDERIVAETVAAMVEDMGHEVVGMAHTLASAREGLNQCECDLAILDINLKLGSEGIKLGEQLSESGVPFFFVTSYSDMSTVEAAKKVRPGAYVVKPFTEQDLYVAIEMTMMRASSGIERGVSVRKGNAHARIPLQDIRYMKAENIYVELYTRDKVWLKRSSLKELLQRIEDEHFIQTHRSYAINTKAVTGYSSNEVRIGDEVIPLSRSHRDEVIDALSGI